MLNFIKSGLVSREPRGELHVQTELVHPQGAAAHGTQCQGLELPFPQRESFSCQNMETSLDKCFLEKKT